MHEPEAGREENGNGQTPQFDELTKSFQSGANWFYWIAALSVVNSVVIVFKGEWNFVIGLGITQVVDAIATIIAEDAGEWANVIAGVGLVISILGAGVFAGFGVLANKRLAWAFIVGMVLYFFDGLLFLLVQDWLSLAFHGFALFCIFGGYTALKKLREAEAATGYSAA